MKRTISLCVPLLVLFALVVPSLAACGSSTTEPPQEFKSETGRFSIMAPYALEETTQSVDTEAGTIEIHMFVADRGQESWLVGYSDYPEEIVQAADPQLILEGAGNGAAANVDGELVSIAQTSLNDYPGRKVTISAQAQNGQDMVVQGHMFLVGNRLYQILVVVPKGQESRQEIADFLQSFQLIGE